MSQEVDAYKEGYRDGWNNGMGFQRAIMPPSRDAALATLAFVAGILFTIAMLVVMHA